ncbi:hypothetical protein HYZ78_04355 [Candidatus Microgenomates bacterium]|nr:hypothetical protein [Candidatus Microgenomates bacterium]
METKEGKESFDHYLKLAEQSEVVDTQTAGLDHPIIQGWYNLIRSAACEVDRQNPAYDASQRLIEIVDNGKSPDEIDFDDLDSVFRATEKEFYRAVFDPQN